MDWIKAMLSENGEPSSKRVSGLIVILVVLGCTIGITIKEGGTMVVQNLLMTEFSVGCALIGLASVTSIFKKD